MRLFESDLFVFLEMSFDALKIVERMNFRPAMLNFKAMHRKSTVNNELN